MKIAGKETTPTLWGNAKDGVLHFNVDIAKRVMDGEMFSSFSTMVEVSFWEKNESGRMPVYYIPLKLVLLRWMLLVLSKFKIFPRKLWNVFEQYSSNISIITADSGITSIKVGYIENDKT